MPGSKSVRNLNPLNIIGIMPVSLKISNVKKSFAGTPVLRGINLELKGSEIIGLVGKSGCGKSTLLKILVGYYKADEGSIFLKNKNISGKPMELRRVVGYTTQENSFYEKLSVLENMKYYASLYGLPLGMQKSRIDSLLEQVGLLEHKATLAENLSGGMKRRLDFAISLIHNPSVLILDEPTAGLDPLLVDNFWNIVKEAVSGDGRIAIVASHTLSEIEKYCTKAAVINNGRVIAVLEGENMRGLDGRFRKLVGK